MTDPATSDATGNAAKQVLIAANPSSGRRPGGQLIGPVAARLRAAGFPTEIVTNLDQATALAAAYHQERRLRAVVAAGGDGTVAELANRVPPGLPLTVFPLGTANLLARYLRIRAEAESFVQMISEGRLIRLDAGRANGRLFLLMVGCGFDAHVVHRLHQERTGHIRYLSYAKPILASIRSYQYPELRVYCEPSVDDQPGEAQPISARWAFVSNLPRYAGGLRIAPWAVGTDGLLDLCTLRRGSLWHGLWYLGHVRLGWQGRLADCRSALVRRVRLESDSPVPYQLDGDPGGWLPVEIEVLPQHLSLLVPTKFANGTSTSPSLSPI